MVVIVWYLDVLSVQSVPITTKVVSSIPSYGEVYWIQHYMIKFVLLPFLLLVIVLSVLLVTASDLCTISST